MTLEDHTNLVPTLQTEDLCEPSTKKRKVVDDEKPSKIKRRRSRNDAKSQESLAQIMEMPMDVFVEIASYLSPVDLLALSRSSKRLRQILLSRSSRVIWRISLRQVLGLPECPSDLDEPVYASLMFDEHCWYCGKKSKRVDYLIRMRSCSSCDHDGALLRAKDFTKHFPTVPTTILSCLPHNASGYNMAAVMRFVEKYKAMGKQGGRYDWMREQQNNNVKNAKKFYKEVDNYVSEIALAKAEDLTNIISTRVTSIESQLEALGYEKKYFPYGDDEFWGMLNQPRELTTRAWNSISPRLIQLVAAQKQKDEERRRKELRRQQVYDLYQQHRHTFAERLSKNLDDTHASVAFTSWRLFRELPSVANLLHDSQDPNVATNNVEDMWKEAEQNIQLELDEFGKKSKTYLFARLWSGQLQAKRQGYISDGDDDYREDFKARFENAPNANYPPLLYPTSLFRCLCCVKTYHYPAIFTHSCPTKRDMIREVCAAPGDYTMMVKLMNIMNVQHLDVHSEQFRAKADMKQLLCGCCDPDIRRPMTFWELLQHYDREESIALRIKGVKGYSNTYLDTHHRTTIAGGNTVPAIWISEEEAIEREKEYSEWVHREEMQHDRMTLDGKTYRRVVWCRLCPRDNRFPMANPTQRAVVVSHIKTHHGKEPLPSDLMWTSWYETHA
ncbi:hypothetical protein FRC02_007618 [Tulasnella sp. 418]|nr:hypothetical protein FRC02_007618 [Tulasnella sp. 418]